MIGTYGVFEMKCEVCGSSDTHLVLDLGLQPLCDDLIPLESSESCIKYPLRIWHCKNCDTGLQEVNVNKNTLFPTTYHYRARNTPSVLSSMNMLVSDVQKDYFPSLENIKVLDIGCNDGSLLKYFKAKGAKTFGIDPTNAINDATHIDKSWQDFFNPFTALKKKEIGFPDIITFTNCFAHIENMNELMTSLSALMGPETLAIIENHYFKAVVQRNQFDTFYHEHPRTYSAKSFDLISQLLGAKLLKLETTTRYGGNIRAFITRSSSFRSGQVLIDDYNFSRELSLMAKSIPKWQTEKLQFIKEKVKQLPTLVGIAFPGRSILVNLLGLTQKKAAT